jgi:hypothetical protein
MKKYGTKADMAKDKKKEVKKASPMKQMASAKPAVKTATKGKPAMMKKESPAMMKKESAAMMKKGKAC